MRLASWFQQSALSFLVLIVAGSGENFAAEASTKPSRPSKSPRFASAIAPDEVRPHVQFLADPRQEGRSGAGARRSAEYIVRHFQQLKLRPLFENSYYQSIPLRTIEGKAPQVAGRNIGAILEGSDPNLRDEIIIVSAHYDHLGSRDNRIYHGADDNATGVAMMIEVARQLVKPENRPARSVAFIGFDLEEQMLWGSRWFAAHPPWPLDRVKLFLTADMVGRSLGSLKLPTVFVFGSEHAPVLKRYLNEIGEPKGLQVSRLGIDLIGTRSDYGPFRDRRIPFLFFSTGQSSVYHSPLDVAETIDYEKLSRVSGLVLKIVSKAANESGTPEWVEHVLPDLDEARALLGIATMVLEGPHGEKLSSFQQLILTQAKNHSRSIVLRGKMTASERVWLTRLSKLMLLSVF